MDGGATEAPPQRKAQAWRGRLSRGGTVHHRGRGVRAIAEGDAPPATPGGGAYAHGEGTAGNPRGHGPRCGPRGLPAPPRGSIPAVTARPVPGNNPQPGAWCPAMKRRPPPGRGRPAACLLDVWPRRTPSASAGFVLAAGETPFTFTATTAVPCADPVASDRGRGPRRLRGLSGWGFPASGRAFPVPEDLGYPRQGRGAPGPYRRARPPWRQGNLRRPPPLSWEHITLRRLGSGANTHHSEPRNPGGRLGSLPSPREPAQRGP
jgi:hypothetical protein